MSPARPEFGGDVPGFPRVSGDEPTAGTWRAACTAFSPRERG